MAWLNIAQEFGRGWSETWDYGDDEYDEIFESEFGDLGIIYCIGFYRDRPLPCDDLPFRESQKTRAREEYGYWSFGYHHIKIDGKHIWTYRHRVLSNSIGKPFNTVFSQYCYKVPIQYQNEFLDNFRGKYNSNPDYWIDSNGLIQESEERQKYRKERQEQRKKPYIRKSHDWEGGYINRETGNIINKYDFNWYYTKEIKEKFDYRMIKGSEIKVQKGSSIDRRFYYEDKTKRKARYKTERIQRKQKQYSFKTKTEIEAKLLLESQRLENENNILRHGFDSKESFRGEHYHGRKNKRNGKRQTEMGI